VQRERETVALRRYLRHKAEHRRATSALARVEIGRIALLVGRQASLRARRELSRFDDFAVDDGILDRAAALLPATRLRSLDAIHVATAELLGADLHALVTYDTRMAAAATELGLPVEAPA